MVDEESGETGGKTTAATMILGSGHVGRTRETGTINPEMTNHVNSDVLQKLCARFYHTTVASGTRPDPMLELWR